MKRVLIRPPFQDWCGNRLFREGTSYTGLYQEAFSLWKQESATKGFQIDTWNQAPLETADIFWFLDLPPTRKEFEHIRAQLKPGTKLVLQILESPVLAIHEFAYQNTQDFDFVLSYEHPELVSKRHRYVHYHLPNQLRQPTKNVPFEERRGLLLINSNRVEGLWAIRQVGLGGLPGIGKFLTGWYCSPAMVQEALSGELYSHRRKIARLAERIAPDFLDIYGRGWDGEQVSWCPVFPNRPYGCWRGIPKISKHALCEQYRFVLCFENFRGDHGYISEKIFDPIFAGSVPVYLGDEQIHKYVPPEIFIDARNFDDYSDLLQSLISFPKDQWKKMRKISQEFIHSDQFTSFKSMSFVSKTLNVLQSL